MSSVNYNKMTKKDLVERCKTLENLLVKKNINIQNELVLNNLLEKDEDVKTQYGIDYYFNTEKDEDDEVVCINVNFNKI